MQHWLVPENLLYLRLCESDDDEEEEEDDGDDGADVLDDQSGGAGRLDLERLWHLGQDGDRAEPGALAVCHLRRGVNDVTVSRIPSTVCAEVRIPPDALPDLNAEPLHVCVPEKSTAYNSCFARSFVVKCHP